MAPREGSILALLLGLALALRVGVALVTPPFQGPDEVAHRAYVRAVAASGRLPVGPPMNERLFSDVRHQYYQPPLAYVLFAPVDRALRAMGIAFPSDLRFLRVQNALYGVGTAAAGYALTARLTPPGDVRRFLVTAIIALFPGFVGNSSVLNNDALANLLSAVLWLTLAGVDKRPWLAGAVLGAAGLTKLSALAQAPLIPIVWALRRPAAVGRVLRDTTIAAGVTLVVLLPWMLRNLRVYGSPLGIDAGSMSFEFLESVLPIEMVQLMAQPQPARAFSQFWGHFGIYNNLQWRPISWVWVPLAAIGLLGWVVRRNGPSGDRWPRLAVAAGASLALAVFGLVMFSLRYHAAWQGRYLYSAMLPFALLLAGGWARWLPSRRAAWLALLILIPSLVALDVVLAVKLDQFFTTVPRPLWGHSTVL